MVCYFGQWSDGSAEFRRISATSRGRTETELTASSFPGEFSGGVRSYLAGEFAGAQAVLHGQRLGHVGHRLVELLQVALVLHLQAV